EARNIYGYHSKLSQETNLGTWALQSVYGAGFRLDQTRNTELSHTINRNTVLEYKQLGDIRETNAFAYAEESIEKGKWLLNIGTRLDYFNFHYLDKLVTDQLPDQDKVIVSPKLNIQYTLNTKSQI